MSIDMGSSSLDPMSALGTGRPIASTVEEADQHAREIAEWILKQLDQGEHVSIPHCKAFFSKPTSWCVREMRQSPLSEQVLGSRPGVKE